MGKMSFDIKKISKAVKTESLPRVFERYEILIVLLGTLVAFAAAGYIFYEKAYRTVSTPPRADVRLPRIDHALFEKTLKELLEKKQVPLPEVIVDPFR